MSNLTATRKAEITARINTKKGQLAKAEAAFDAVLNEPIESYNFNSGEGSQAAKNRKLSDLQDTIDRLENQIDCLERKLRGGGVVNITVRRK